MQKLKRVTTMSILVAILNAGAVAAQEWDQIAYYTAHIGPEDRRTSQGVAVSGLGGLIQQDRANYHRFGIRHAQDDDDPIFADRAMRARIPAMVEAGKRGSVGAARLAAGNAPFTVGVFVCGYGGVPSMIFVARADHSGCW